MPITDLLERNSKLYGEEVALVEINPEVREEQRVSWQEYELIQPTGDAPYRREITWSVFDEKANRVANMLLGRGIRKGQKVAMGKATIVKPKGMFHNREMPDGVFKVNVASVLAGFEDLPPPVPVDDDETPKMIGACKSWFLPWPKSLLCLEAPSITPTPPSQEGMNTTPPTKLPAPVVADDSGRREG